MIIQDSAKREENMHNIPLRKKWLTYKIVSMQQ